MRRKLIFSILGIVTSLACQLTSTQIPLTPFETEVSTDTAFSPVTNTATLLAPTITASLTQTDIPTETPLPSETASPSPSHTSLSTVESLQAKVTADLLS